MTQEKFLLVTQPEIPGPQKYLKVSHFPLFFQKKKEAIPPFQHTVQR